MDTFLMYAWNVILGICLLNGVFTLFVGYKDLSTFGFSLNMFLMGILPYMLFLHLVKNNVFNVSVSFLVSIVFLCIICYAGVCCLVKVLKMGETIYD